MQKQKVVPESDLTGEVERARAVASWRGVVVQLRRRGGWAAVAAVRGPMARQLGLALRATPAGHAQMVHARGCRRRDDQCRCHGVRLVAGASA